jgi:hypothetical protein
MPVFASIHLGKCAGSAFAKLLIREVSPQMPVLLFYGQGHPTTGLWNNRAREPIKTDGNPLKEICGPLLEGAGGTCLVHGHITAREYLEFLPEEREVFTWLRHPLQRICSHYYYWKNNRDEPRQRPEARRLFESVVSGDCSLVQFGCHPMIAEYYSAMLDPLGLDGLAFAALTEHPERSLMRLSALLGIDLPSEMPVINTTRSKGAKAYELKREEELQILAANAADMELYHRALAQLAGDAQRSAI